MAPGHRYFGSVVEAKQEATKPNSVGYRACTRRRLADVSRSESRGQGRRSHGVVAVDVSDIARMRPPGVVSAR